VNAPGGAPDTPLLQLRDLRVGFDTDEGVVWAVDGVDLTVHRGRTLGLVGESGSGKTVLSRSVMNLVASSRLRRSGEILFEGRNLLDLGRDQMNRVLGAEVAMVFQDPMTALNPVFRIGAQLTEGLRLHRGLSKSEAYSAGIDLLRSVHIPAPDSIMRRYPHQLSGGMRQRVMIAIAIACGPKLLLADEPTTAVDVTVQAQILNLLEEKRRESGMGMVLISHDLGVVAARTDDVAVMYAGKIVEHGPVEAVFGQMRMPYTEALFKSIPRLDKATTRLHAIGGRPPNLLHPPPGCRFAPRCPYAQARCREEEPPLTAPDASGHRWACWYPVGTPTSAEVRSNGRGLALSAAGSDSVTGGA
jgi:oligopeptide/dipeptide ABC transporter ATP-binding protein